MPTRLPGTDVVVIGLGAAGGVAVLPLAEAGLDVVGLEAGSRLTKNDFAPDELRNNMRAWPFVVQKTQREIPTARPDRRSQATRSSVHPMMNGVGGTSLHYWAQSWRLNPWDFKVVTETSRRYGRDRLPEGSTVEDWPFGYDELERYYDRVEHEIGVSGQAGNVNGEIDRRGNRFEGRRDWIGVGTHLGGLDEHIRAGPELGVGLEGVYRGKCRPVEHLLYPEDDLAL